MGIYTQHMRLFPESTYPHSRRDGDPPCIHSPSLRYAREYEWTAPRKSHEYDPTRGVSKIRSWTLPRASSWCLVGLNRDPPNPRTTHNTVSTETCIWLLRRPLSEHCVQ